MKFNKQLEQLLKTLDKFIDKEGNLLKNKNQLYKNLAVSQKTKDLNKDFYNE